MRINKYVKIIRAIKNIVLYKLFNIKKPILTEIRLTNHCNQNCIYCNIPNQKKWLLTFQDVKKIVDKVKKDCVHIVLSGGEASLSPDLGRIINYIKKNDFYLVISTNGSLIKWIDELEGVNLVSMSLDGTKKINDKHRGDGSYNKTIKLINALKNKGIPAMVICVLTKHNYKYIADVSNFCKDLGVKCFFQSVYKYKDTKQIKNMALTKNQLKKAVDLIINEKKKNPHIVNSTDSLKYYLNNYPYQIMQCNICPCGDIFLYVDKGRRVNPCEVYRNNQIKIDTFKSLSKVQNSLTKPINGGCSCYFPVQIHCSVKSISTLVKSFLRGEAL